MIFIGVCGVIAIIWEFGFLYRVLFLLTYFVLGKGIYPFL